MGLGTRVFLINDKDALQRLSLAKFERLLRGDHQERLLQYAGKRIRYALVILEVENRKPVGIIMIQYSYLTLDADGKLDAAEREKEAILAIEIVPPVLSGEHSKRFIDARHRFAKKRYDHRYKWKPSPQMEAGIVKAVFGKDGR
jgi:hypothetical protein